MTDEAVAVRATDNVIELIAPNFRATNRTFSEFSRSCELSTYPAAPGKREEFEARVSADFSPEKFIDLSGDFGESLEYQKILWRHAKLMVERYDDMPEEPVIAIERAKNLEYWKDIADVLSGLKSIDIEDLRSRSYDILEKRMTSDEFREYAIADR